MIGLRPPSFPLLRDSQSQRFVEESGRLSLQVGESSWTLLPTGAVVNSQETSSSPYRAFRRQDGVMSRYTARENQRLKKHFERFRSVKPTPTLREDQSPPIRTPTDSDYQRLIDRLHKAQTGFRGNKRLTLVEDKVENCLLDQDDVQYMRVPVLNQPTPLRVVFRRNKGRLVAYVSRTVAEPSDSLADAIVYRDVVRVIEATPKFKGESVFIAVKALSAAAFTVRVYFGKSDLTRSYTSQPNKDHRVRSQEELLWEELENSPQSKGSPSRSVNHIKQNLIILPPTSPIRRAAAKLRTRQATEKRQSALFRKQSLLEEQRKRKYKDLHRQEARLRELEQKRAFQTLRSRKEACEKDWIRAIAWAKASQAILNCYQVRKAELALQVKKAKSATLIQAHFRRVTRGVGRPGIALRHCRNALLLYSRLTSSPFVHTIKLKLLTVLQEARELSIIPTALRTTLRAGNVYSSCVHPEEVSTLFSAENRISFSVGKAFSESTGSFNKRKTKQKEEGNRAGTSANISRREGTGTGALGANLQREV